MKIAALSDLHGHNLDFQGNIYEEPELLILAGDLCSQDYVGDQEKELKILFKNIKKSFPNIYRTIVVPGNHDFWFETHYKSSPSLFETLGSGVTVLVDSEYDYYGLRIYGTPRTDLNLFAFPHLQGMKDIENIPEGIDILVTHEAPRIPGSFMILEASKWYDNPGNEYLWLKSQLIRPKYHLFGHIHRPMNSEHHNDVTYINVSQLRGSKPCFNPVIFEIP